MSRTSSTHSQRGRGGNAPLQTAHTTIEQDMTSLARSIDASPEEVLNLPGTLLTQIMEVNGLNPRQQARLLIHRDRHRTVHQVPEKHRDDNVQSLAAHFQMQREERLFPWKSKEERSLGHIRHMNEQATKENAFNDLRVIFEQRAKAKLLSEAEVIILTYLLFPPKEGNPYYSLAALLLLIPPDDRVAVHNWTMAAHMPLSEKNAYGETIATLSDSHTPLFPTSSSACGALNTQLFAEIQAGPAIHGAGPSSSLFASRHITGQQLRGAGMIPVGQLNDGTWAADVSTLENANRTLKRQIVGLERKVARLQAEPETRTRDDYQKGRSNASSYRGARGRGGRLRGGGGTFEESTFDNKAENPTVLQQGAKQPQPFRSVSQH